MSSLVTASVGLAACNGEEYIDQQITSILDQLKDRDELIISCDPSTDRTHDIAKWYSACDKRVHYLKNDDFGIVGNFNNALSNCKGDIIFISDQDDVWIEGKRDAVVRRLIETNASLLVHNAINISNEDDIESRPFFDMYNIKSCPIRSLLFPRWSGCTMAFPQRTKELILPLPKSVRGYDNWIQIVCEFMGEVVFLDDVLLLHRIHDNNATVGRRSLHDIVIDRGNIISTMLYRCFKHR